MDEEDLFEDGLPEAIRPALEHCREITRGGNPNLWQAACTLDSGPRYRFFLACYAAMRVLDDEVDDAFLELDEAHRVERRPGTLAYIDRWLDQVEAACVGRYDPADGDIEPLVFTALSALVGRSDLGPEPFRRLARSLRRDVEEKSLGRWEDFLEYCEGASVAPGSVFIYLLACRVDEDGFFRLDLPETITFYARDMALFCYVTHIIRDLPEDAVKNPQLLTLPRDVLESCGMSLESCREAVVTGDERRLAPFLAELHRRGAIHAERAEARVGELAPYLEPHAKEVLTHLFGLYVATFRECLDRD